MKTLNGQLISQESEIVLHKQPGDNQLINFHGLDSVSQNPAAAYLMSLNSKRSRKTMASVLNNVARMIGQNNLQQCAWPKIRRPHVQGILAMLSDSGKAPATINNYLAAIKGVALEAWTMKLLDTEDYQHIKHVKSVKGSRVTKGRALRMSEIRSLFRTCEDEDTTKGIRDAAMLSLLLGCGLRRSELVALDYHDLIHREQAIKVLGKGNKERIAFVPDSTWERIELWIEEVRGEEPGPLFVRIRKHDDTTRDRMTDQAVYHILETLRRVSGVESFSPHDLRRTFASTLLDNGEDIVTVKDAMGHSSIATTQKYDRRGDDRLRNASKKLNF